jgi:hypothetical protein
MAVVIRSMELRLHLGLDFYYTTLLLHDFILFSPYVLSANTTQTSKILYIMALIVRTQCNTPCTIKTQPIASNGPGWYRKSQALFPCHHIHSQPYIRFPMLANQDTVILGHTLLLAPYRSDYRCYISLAHERIQV